MNYLKKTTTFSIMIALLAALSIHSLHAQTPSPALWYKLNETSGTIATDSSGNGYDGTLSADPTWDTGIYNGALHFNGNGYINVPVSLFEHIQDGITISFWSYGDDSPPPTTTVFEAVDADGNRILSADLPCGDNIRWGAGRHRNAYDTISVNAPSLPYGTAWNYWTFVKNFKTCEMKIYHNGTLLLSRIDTKNGISNIAAFHIGASVRNFDCYKGRMDDFRIYGTPLSQEQITALSGGSPDLTVETSSSVFNNSITTSLSTFSPNAVIHYTTDGSNPDSSSPIYSSPLTFSSTTQLKAKAFTATLSSPLKIEYYLKDSYMRGIMMKYYDVRTSSLPDFDQLTPIETTTIKKIDFPTSYYNFATTTLVSIGAIFEGYILVPDNDTYTFYLSSDDGSKLYIDNSLLITNDGIHAIIEKSNSITLAAGLHHFKIEYFNASGNNALLLAWSSSNLNKQIVEPKYFYMKNSDNDNLPDKWELDTYGDLSKTGDDDFDNDSFSDAEELTCGAAPESACSAPLQNLSSTPNLEKGLVFFYQGEWSNSTPGNSMPPHAFTYLLNGPLYLAERPSGLDKNAATCFKGYINVPEDGIYLFQLERTYRTATIKIDDKNLFYNDFSNYSYKSISLKAGIHKFEISSLYCYWSEASKQLILKLNWITPSSEKWSIIPPSVLLHDPQYLADMQNSDDDDADGLTNNYENNHNLNPDDSDSDGDGLYDGEEVELGTNPLLADTDGDGVNDYTEAKIAFSNPLAADFDGSQTNLSTIHGSGFSTASTGWMKDANSIYSIERNGWIQYNISISNPDTYILKLSAEQHNSLFEGESSFLIDIYVDGSYSGTQTLIAPEGAEGTSLFFLPKLSAGNHSVKLVWKNMESETFLQINSLELLSLGGTDTNSNGIADWLENRIAKLGGITIPQQTKVSPVCAEGENAANIDQMAITGFYTPPGENPTPPVFRHGIKNSWYSDISLDPANTTNLTFSFQNGATTVNRSVTWIETNIIQETTDTIIRLNDSLLLNAYPEGATAGTISITVEGNTLTPTVGAPIPYKFENTGDITLNATYTPDGGGTPLTKTLTVKVVSGTFSSPPICILNDPRIWKNPGIPDEAYFENDSSVSFNTADIPTGGKSFYIVATDIKPAYIVARLGENGPVFDSTEVKALNQIINPENKLTILETFPDGSKMVEGYIILSNIPDDFKIRIDISTGGILFMNGSTRLWVSADDFDENGIFRYRMIVPADKTGGICHSFWFYQDDLFIGDE